MLPMRVDNVAFQSVNQSKKIGRWNITVFNVYKRKEGINDANQVKINVSETY